jgi:hypothetical protein
VNRVRWFHTQLPINLRAMADQIGRLPLELDGDTGFKIARVRHDSIQASYYERFTWTDSGVDPFGREFSYDRQTYKVVRFILSKNYPELEIIDAPRGLSSLFSRFAELTDFKVTIQPMRVDVLRWAEGLRTSYEGTFRVASMSVTDLDVEDGVTGSLSVSSRNEDVKDAATRLLSRRKYSIQKLQLALKSRVSEALLTLTSDGSVKSSFELEPNVLSAVRQAFPQQQHDPTQHTNA